MDSNNGDLVGKLQDLAKRCGRSLYAFAQIVGIPRSSVYYYDAEPDRLTVKYANKAAEVAKLTDAEYGAWLRGNAADTKRHNGQKG